MRIRAGSLDSLVVCSDLHTTNHNRQAIKIVDKHAKKRFQSRFAFSQSLQSQRLSSTGGGHSTANATRGSSIAGSLGSTTANAGSGSAGALSTTFDAVNNLQLEKIKHEIAIMKKIDHRNVVVLREVIDDPEAAKVYLVLEYMAGGEVEWRDTSRDPPRPVMGPADARRILRDVVCGLEYLHHNGIIHRDIKPANLLWEDAARRRVKISDFGVSVFVDVLARDCSAVQMELAKTAGSPAFFAPELCAVVDDDEDEGEEGTAASARGGAAGDETSTVSFAAAAAIEIGAAIDVWALGVTLFCLIYGRVPFVAETEFELFHVICKSP
ncbi:kinase-like domain-containing protein [Chytriomyces sp. MP71]|nr:kinase-like domain-containing protein [Chytriomyces sp. MP71]